MDRYRVQRADAAVHNALDWVDRVVRRMREDPSEPELEPQIRATIGHLDRAKERLKGRNRPEALGLLAGAEKREAQMFDLSADFLRDHDQEAKAEEYRRRADQSLATAQKLYEKVFRQDLRQNWAIAQALSLSVVRDRPHNQGSKLWHLAQTAAHLDLQKTSDQRWQAWGYSTLAELYLLAPCIPELEMDVDHCRAQALDAVRQLVPLADDFPIDIYTARQQFMRYSDWYRHLCPTPSFQQVLDLARQMTEILPSISPADSLSGLKPEGSQKKS